MSFTSSLIAGGLAVLLIVMARRWNRVDASTGINLATATEADIQVLVSAGRKIDAIKVYRRLHRVDLKAAKDAIDRLEASIPRLPGEGPK